MRLEPRDRAVLAEVFLSKVVRRDDLINFGYFSSVPRCNARLLALRGEGLLKARTELGGMDLRATLYHCTAKGVRIAADELEISPDEAIEIHRSGIRELAIKHALACSDLRTRFLHDLSGDSVLRLGSWSQELLCHHEFQIAGKAMVIKPDALAEMQVGGHRRMLFIEVDLGNAAIPKVKEKIGRYRTYAESGTFSEAYGIDRFTVLLVTTDERRMAHLHKLAASNLMAFSTWKRLSAQGLKEQLFATATADRLHLQEVLR